MRTLSLQTILWLIVGSVLQLQVLGCTAPPAGQPVSDNLSTAIDAIFAPFDEGISPGVAVAVIQDGDVIHQAGYGIADLETEQPIAIDTQFRLASVSKQFTVMAIMILATDGVLEYDDPITKYLPELDRFQQSPTIRQLLNHTGGLPDYYDTLEEATGDVWPTTEEAATFYQRWGEPVFSPGDQFEYSNPGYELLATIVARASDLPIDQFMEERIFEPLGMDNTVVFDETEPELPFRALGYSRQEDAWQLDDSHVLNHVAGSGGIYSTVEDLVLWDRALDASTLIPKERLDEAFEPAILANGEESLYGFGWELAPDPSLGTRHAHSGGWVGFSNYMVRLPDQSTTIILLSNNRNFDGLGFSYQIQDLLFPHPATIIVNAVAIDGTGTPAFRANVRIEEGRIATVGDVGAEEGDLIIDAEGLVLAPGFIDTHSHADEEIFWDPSALADLSQGITTVIVGADGDSQSPLSDFFKHLESFPSAVNVGSWTGHGTIRSEVMGDDFRRSATGAEIDAMRALVRADMDAGALGLSTGLEYDPGIYSSSEEVIELAQTAADLGGRYTSHIRSEDRYFWKAIDEILQIGRTTQIPVNITHVKLAQTSSHGQAGRLLSLLESARAEGLDVTADIYPYTYWRSTLEVLFPERNFEDLEAARYATSEVATPENLYIPNFEPEPALAGKTLAEIAALRGTDPARTLMDLIRQAQDFKQQSGKDEVESVIGTSMVEGDIEALMRWPFTNICTDGSLWGVHPRGFGSFPRVLGRYVRERNVLSLPEAIHRMTGRAAESSGITDRGILEPGLAADLVLFDPEKIIDHATLDDPNALSEGIEKVWVNGSLVWDQNAEVGRRPGQVLRRAP